MSNSACQETKWINPSDITSNMMCASPTGAGEDYVGACNVSIYKANLSRNKKKILLYTNKFSIKYVKYYLLVSCSQNELTLSADL